MADKQSTPDETLHSSEQNKSKAHSSPGDIAKFATTLGGAAVGNMIFPGVGGALLGAAVGAYFALKATKDVADGD